MLSVVTGQAPITLCLTLVVSPDPAGDALRRARIVSLRRLLFSSLKSEHQIVYPYVYIEIVLACNDVRQRVVWW